MCLDASHLAIKDKPKEVGKVYTSRNIALTNSIINEAITEMEVLS